MTGILIIAGLSFCGLIATVYYSGEVKREELLKKQIEKHNLYVQNLDLQKEFVCDLEGRLLRQQEHLKYYEKMVGEIRNEIKQKFGVDVEDANKTD